MTTQPDGTQPAGPPPDVDWADHADYLVQAAITDQRWYRAVAADLTRPGDQLLVDVGCGGAGMAVALAKAVPNAQVVGVDQEAEVLDAARAHVAEIGVAVRLVQTDLTGDAGVLAAAIGGPADLVWASAVVHHAADQQTLVNVLAALLAPGGRLALAEGGLSSRYLPWDVGIGQPGLELRLESAQDRWFAAMRAGLPGAVSMPYGWNRALRHAGLVDVSTRTRLIERPAPLPADARAWVADKLAHRVGRLTELEMIGSDDVTAWQHILDRDTPEWLGRRDDVFVLDARSVHLGVNPG